MFFCGVQSPHDVFLCECFLKIIPRSLTLVKKRRLDSLHILIFILGILSLLGKNVENEISTFKPISQCPRPNGSAQHVGSSAQFRDLKANVMVGVADCHRFSPWSLGDFTLSVNGLIHFVWKHPSLLKRYNDESILMVGWLKKGGSASAFLLVFFFQDILKKRTKEVKLRNPQGVEPGGAPILHVFLCPTSLRVT